MASAASITKSNKKSVEKNLLGSDVFEIVVKVDPEMIIDDKLPIKSSPNDFTIGEVKSSNKSTSNG